MAELRRLLVAGAPDPPHARLYLPHVPLVIGVYLTALLHRVLSVFQGHINEDDLHRHRGKVLLQPLQVVHQLLAVGYP